MSGLVFFLPIVVIIIVARIIVAMATVALMQTGLDRHKARFQALSAFSGAGFTTKESEKVVTHPTRRKIISWLIVLGNAGIVTLIASLVGSIAKSTATTLPIGILSVALVLLTLRWLSRRRGWTQRFEKWVEYRMWESTFFKKQHIQEVITVEGEFVVGRILVREDSAMGNRKLRDLKLNHKGILVLAINRKGRIIRPPRADSYLRVGDIATVFGKLKQLEASFSRKLKTE